MKQEIINQLRKLASEYVDRADIAYANEEYKNSGEYSDKANGIFEAIDVVKGIKEE